MKQAIDRFSPSAVLIKLSHVASNTGKPVILLANLEVSCTIK